MKKRLCICLALVLLAACGACAPEKPASSQSQSQVQTVPNTAFARADVISANITKPLENGDAYPFDQCNEWAAEYVEKNYEQYGAEITRTDYIGGFMPDVGVICDRPVACYNTLVSYTAVTQPPYPSQTNGIYTLPVQVLCFTDNGVCTLSGIFSGPDVMESLSDVQGELALDRRCDTFDQPVPTVSDKSAALINLTSITGLSALDVVALTSTRAAVSHSRQILADPYTVLTRIMFIDLHNLKIVSEQTYVTETGYIQTEAEGENLRVLRTDGNEKTCFDVYSPDGRMLSQNQPQTVDSGEYNVGGRLVTEENGKLWVTVKNEKTLLADCAGTQGESPEAYEELRVAKVLDDSRFLYTLNLYEGAGYSAIYDFNDGSSLKLTSEGGDSSELIYRGISDNTLVMSRYGEGINTLPADSRDGVCKKICDVGRNSDFSLSPEYDRVAVIELSDAQSTGPFTVREYSTLSGEPLYSTEFYTPGTMFSFNLRYTQDGSLALYSASNAVYDGYIALLDK